MCPSINIKIVQFGKKKKIFGKNRLFYIYVLSVSLNKTFPSFYIYSLTKKISIYKKPNTLKLECDETY